eukprot:gene8941-18499_t
MSSFMNSELVEDFEDVYDTNLERSEDPDGEDSMRYSNMMTISDGKSMTPSAPVEQNSLPSEVVAQNTTNYAILTKEELINYSESELIKINAEAVAKFNMKPKSVREYLISQKVIQGLPSEIASFIFHQPKLSKRRIGEYIGNEDSYNQAVCESLFALYKFSSSTLDSALRILMKEFRLPGEAQQIDRILEKFAISYHTQNSGVFLSSDTAYVLSFSLIMLNTDLHNHSIPVEKKMTLDQFIRNNRGINQGTDLPQPLLERLYYSVRDHEITMDEADLHESEVVAFMAPTKSGWLAKKSETTVVSLSQWKRHWFVLNDGCLYYFNQPSDEGPRCIIPLDNTQTNIGTGPLDFVITSASGDFVKASTVMEDGRMAQGRHPQFVFRGSSEEDRQAWVAVLQEESHRFRPLHDVFLRIREQERKQVDERRLVMPQPIASGWMRKRGAPTQSWKRRFFCLYPDFDGGGITLFYYVNQQVAQKMLDMGLQTQQGYLRMNAVKKVTVSSDLRWPFVEAHTEDRVWTFSPDEAENTLYWYYALQKASEPYTTTTNNSNTNISSSNNNSST